jgi:hypothetical protein
MTITRDKLNDLSNDARRWVAAMQKLFEFEPHGEELLLTCARLLDRIHQAREAVKQEGSYFTDRHGVVRAHPALKVERDSQALFAVLIQRLKLPDAPLPFTNKGKK